MDKEMRIILQDLIWAVLNGDDLDKWMEIRDSTSPDLQGFLEVFGSLVEKKSQQICQLFEPKPTEGWLLTDEEIERHIAIVDKFQYSGVKFYQWSCLDDFQNVANAQDAKTKREMVEWVEENIIITLKNYEEKDGTVSIMPPSVRMGKWQALRKEVGLE